MTVVENELKIIQIDTKNCPSTHGGSGYPIGAIVEADGKMHCQFCGIEMQVNPAGFGSHVLGPDGQPINKRKEVDNRFWLTRILFPLR